ncbi:transmembrane protein 252 [Athene noctua]|uniref:transmembrane protein 252 n=1 Tax=Athene noctua TaxID=126797 RepID=UPI003EBB65E0
MLKGFFTFIRLFVLLLGFSTICLGVLCVFTSSPTCKCGNNKLVFYCLLALGFFLLITGIFWSTFHEALKYRSLSSILIQNPSCRELHVSTVDRPDFYPPSYEDSTDPEKQNSPLPVVYTLNQQEVINIPLPPYSKSSAEFTSETSEQEQPPPYELPEWQLQQQQTADQDSDPGAELNSPPSIQEKSNKQDTDCQGTPERAAPARTSEIGSG